MNKTNEIDILIGKVVSGNASKDELSRLEIWQLESETNQRIYKQSLKAWKAGSSSITSKEITQDKINVQNQVNRSLVHQLNRSKRFANIYKLAAAVAIPIALAISLYFVNNSYKVELPQSICEVSSPKGHVSKCILPDGTEVWLNAGSTLSYDASGFHGKQREVELEGEAYFEVVSNKKNPFLVNTELANVYVTGTSFNVKAYTDTKQFETVLAEGRVELQFNMKNQQTVKMKPGERAIYKVDKKEMLIQDVNAAMYSAWRKGELLFKDATLNDLIKELERIYDIQFVLEDKSIGDYRFRGMFSYSNNLIDALEKIKITAGVDYYIENKSVWLKKDNK